MSGGEAWVVVGLAGVATVALKGLGPALLGGRALPPRLLAVVGLLAPALLAALVVTQAFGAGDHLAVDARVVGLAAAAVALVARAPALVLLAVAAPATAHVRML
ncbi:MAG: AzlD domain-containing protein [Actinobacteria bacterium]|nr:AzlD domain-containing protein [Actinomycetota bacterium]